MAILDQWLWRRAKNAVRPPSEGQNEEWITEHRRKEAIRILKRNHGQCEFMDLLHQVNVCIDLPLQETPQTLKRLLEKLEQEGWIQLNEENGRHFVRYLFGEDDIRWLGETALSEDEQKIHIYRMSNGLLSRDQAILDYLRAHGEERFLVRELLARVFGEEEKVTSKMVRDSLEWLTEKELATVEEDENGRLLFHAAPEAEAHAQTQE